MNKSILEKCVSADNFDREKMRDELQALSGRIIDAAKTDENGISPLDAPFILIVLENLCKSLRTVVENANRLLVIYKAIERMFGVTTIRVEKKVREEK